MNKVSILFIFLTIMFFSACGSDVHYYGIEYYIPYEEIEQETQQNLSQSQSNTSIRWIELNEYARDIVIQDLNFLENAILDNVAILNVIYRRLGTTIDVIFENLRATAIELRPLQSSNSDSWIRDNNTNLDIAADYLFALLYQEPFFRTGIAHLSPISPDLFSDMRARAIIQYNEEIEKESEFIDLFLLHLLDIYNSENVVWFYGNDIDLEIDSRGWMDNNNVSTEIIENYRIARIGMRHFMNSYETDSKIIIPFLKEIEDFEHLIIDFRGHMGGYYNIFVDLILTPLLSEPVYSYRINFITDGKKANHIFDISLESSAIQNPETTSPIVMPIADFLDYFDINYVDDSDFELLYKGIKYFIKFEPSEEYNINFNGKIWLLVDSGSASAAEAAALDSIATNFATVVGRRTRGVMPSPTSVFYLPNTGILFRMDLAYFPSSSGYSMEEFGIKPDILVPTGNILNYLLKLIELK